MAFVDLRVEPLEDGWTVRQDRGLFERFSGPRAALNRALRQAAVLRRAGHDARVHMHDRRDPECRRFPRDRLPGELPPYEC